MKTSISREIISKGIPTIIERLAAHIKRLQKKPIIIAIDGHSSCGKSTLSKDLAKYIGYKHIDTGAMYRAVTLYFIRRHVDIKNQEEVQTALNEIRIDFSVVEGQNITLLNNENVESEIRSLEVSQLVSQVAAISAVRSFLVAQQQTMGLKKGIVMDGRDIGTVVFPNAQLKIFMTADIAVRSQRRYEEMISKGSKESFEAIQANLSKRDHIDSNREDSPLKQAPDAHIIDSSHLSRDEQLSVVLDLASKVI